MKDWCRDLVGVVEEVVAALLIYKLERLRVGRRTGTSRSAGG